MRVEVNADNLMCATCGELMYRRPYNCVHSLENTHVSAYVEVPDPAPAQPQAPVPQQRQEWEHRFAFGGLDVALAMDVGWGLVPGTRPEVVQDRLCALLRRPRRNDAPQGEEVVG